MTRTTTSYKARRAEWVKSAIKSHTDNGWRSPDQTILVVACDRYDYEDYPVFLRPLDVADRIEELQNSSMSSVHEVFDLEGDIDSQLEKSFVWMVPDRPDLWE